MTARLAWVLLKNELRLTWRSYPVAGRWVLISMLGLATLMFHVAAFSFVGIFAATGRELPIAVEQKAWLGLGAFLFGGGVVGASHAIVDRHDADLLLTAPIPPALVVLTRWAAIAASSSLGTLFFGLPFVNAAAFFLGRGYLLAYVVLLLLVAAGATFGLTVALTLLRIFGPRRGRVITQLFGALLSVGMVFGFQSMSFLVREAPGLFRLLSGLADNRVTLAVALAGRGNLVALGLCSGAAVGATALVLRAFGQSLLRGYTEPETSRSRTKGPVRAFDTRLFPAVLRKDVRLIFRDPLLLAKVLPQALILVPIVLGMGRNLAVVGLAGGAVLVAIQLTSLLSAVIASGEEGWDLIRSSPAPERTVLLAKLGASVVVPALASTLLLVPLAVKIGPLPALYAGAVAAVGSFTAAWLEVADIRPTPRRDILRNQRPGHLARSVWALFVSMLGAASAALGASGMWIGALIVLLPYLAACAVTVARRRVLELPE